jgi:hypothetical protein
VRGGDKKCTPLKVTSILGRGVTMGIRWYTHAHTHAAKARVPFPGSSPLETLLRKILLRTSFHYTLLFLGVLVIYSCILFFFFCNVFSHVPGIHVFLKFYIVLTNYPCKLHHVSCTVSVCTRISRQQRKHFRFHTWPFQVAGITMCFSTQPYNGTTIQWDNHTMGQPYNGTTIQWDNHTMGQPYNGTTIQWTSNPIAVVTS